jgi:ornithine cyclodeaminase
MHRTVTKLFSATTTTSIYKPSMLFLSETNVRQCITPSSMMECLEVNRLAYQSITPNGGGFVPSRLGLPYHDQGDWSLFKPAAYYPPSSTGTTPTAAAQEEQDDGITMGLKVVSVRADNPSKRNMPLVPATILVLNAVTGMVDAVVAATYLTGVRTASGSAWATKLCRPDAKHLVIFGAGLQAQCHIDTITTVLGDDCQLERVTIVNRTRERAEALIQANAELYPHLAMDVIVLDDKAAIQQVLEESVDVIVCCTNAATPTLFDGAWLRPNTHVNGIGSYTPDMQEVHPTVVTRCSTVLIDTSETRTVGDLEPLEEMKDDENCPAVIMLGDALNDASSLVLPDASEQTGDLTFYKAVGTAIQDVMVGDWVVKQARKLGIGQSIDMS